MVDEVKAYKSADGTLWHNEEAAYKHDACKEIAELLAGSQYVDYSSRYSFAEEIMDGLPHEWYNIFKIWIEMKERRAAETRAAYDRQVAEAAADRLAEAQMPPVRPWADNSPGVTQEPDSDGMGSLETRRVGLTPVDDEVPF